MVTVAAVNRLGERLRKGPISEDDLRLLDDYRRGFSEITRLVVQELSQLTDAPIASRPAKSTASIVSKLRRGTMRLSRMQDIAGCRVVVSGVRAQKILVSLIQIAFEKSETIDRTDTPSFGYRAVHVVAKFPNGMVEIQVRTSLQHLWAQKSEAFADHFGQELKYGGGDSLAKAYLQSASDVIADVERHEATLDQFSTQLSRLSGSQQEAFLPASKAYAGYLAAVRTKLTEQLSTPTTELRMR